jgi:hypothetical protein
MSDYFAGGDEMSEPLAPRFDDDPYAIDDTIIDGILDGVVDEPLPVAYQSLVAVLATARRPGPEAELTGAAETVAMFRTVRPPTIIRGSFSQRRLLTAKTLLAAGALTVASATAAAAATGSLPGAAQDTASAVLAKVGISVPGPNDHGGDHPNRSGRPNLDTDDSTRTTIGTTSSSVGKGGTISSLATDASTSGIDKALAVSSAASDGHSQTGTNDPPSSTPAGPPSSLPGGPPSSLPGGPPSSLPGGPPSSLPGGPPSSLPGGPPSSLRGGPPSSLPGGPPSSLPATRPPSSAPAGPPSSEAGSPHRP